MVRVKIMQYIGCYGRLKYKIVEELGVLSENRKNNLNVCKSCSIIM